MGAGEYDMSEFSGLGNAGGPQGAPGQGFPPNLPSEFTMHSEDFPALPGANSAAAYKGA